MIDLGHVSAPEIPAWPVRRRPGKGWLSATLAVAVLMLVGAASSGRPDPLPYVTSLAIDPSEPMTFVGDSVYVLDTAIDGSWIRAYALPAGRMRWAGHVSPDRNVGRIYTVGTTLVADTTTPNGDAHTVAGFDPVSGRERWHLTAYDTVHIGTALFVWPPVAAGGASAPLDRIDPATGRVLWSAPMGADCKVLFDDRDDAALATGVVELCADDAGLSVIDLATGRVRSHRTLGGDFLDGGNFLVRDGVIVVVAFAIPAVDIVAYRASDLNMIWTHGAEEASTLAGGCAMQVCIETPHGLATLDLRTGAVVPTVAAVTTSPLGLHPRPGVLEFVIVPPARAGETVLAPFDVTAASMVPPGHTVNVGGYEPGYGATTWITQRLTDGSYRPVGPLTGVGEACGFASGYVLCATSPKRVTFWRLPPIT